MGQLGSILPLLGLPLLWGHTGHREPSPGQGSGRAVWERGQAAQNCSSAVACPALMQDTSLALLPLKANLMCFPAVLYKPLSSQTSLGAEHLQRG